MAKENSLLLNYFWFVFVHISRSPPPSALGYEAKRKPRKLTTVSLFLLPSSFYLLESMSFYFFNIQCPELLIVLNRKKREKYVYSIIPEIGSQHVILLEASVNKSFFFFSEKG